MWTSLRSRAPQVDSTKPRVEQLSHHGVGPTTRLRFVDQSHRLEPGVGNHRFGRKTRVIPAALRRAVIVRDGHCVAPGCTRSPRWADVHHLIHWADGGTTELGNLCLLFRYRHTLVHEDEDFEALVIAQVELNRRRRRSLIGDAGPTPEP